MKLRQTLLIVFVMAVVSATADSTYVSRVEVDALGCAVIRANSFLRGKNPRGESVKWASALKLKYTRLLQGDSLNIPSYYGAGIAVYDYGHLFGRPFSAFVTQGAPLLRLSRSLSLCYDLQLGVSAGWKSFSDNTMNHVLGSPVNAYIGADLFLSYRLSRCWDLNFGYGYLHFSNANLEMPNEGLNAMGLRLSAAYTPDRAENPSRASCLASQPFTGERRWYTDILVYGGMKRKSLFLDGLFGVVGFSVSRMWRLNRAFAIGPSLDGVYDRSMNLLTSPSAETLGKQTYRYPAATKQMALGVQARIELTMPGLQASAGAGRHVLGGFTRFYETLAFKACLTKNVFLHMGYTLYNYHYANNIMLGLGYRLGAN